MRITSARDQYAMLSPWLVEADVSVHPEAVPPGHPGAGRPAMPPPAPDRAGDPHAPWAQHDWHQAVEDGTYGNFNSPARPPSSGDTPHPADLLAQMKPHIASQERTLAIDDETDPTGKRKIKVPRPSWTEMIGNAKDPHNDPAGLLPPHETFRQHVEHMKERIRRGRGYGSPGDPQLPPPGTPGQDYADTTSHDPEANLAHAQQRHAEGPHADNGGKFWYPSAHDRSKGIAEKTHGDQTRTVGTDSALSPLKDWDVNTEQSAHFNTHYPYGGGEKGQGAGVGPTDNPTGESAEGWRVPAPNPQNDKSRKILDAPPGVTQGDVADILQGPKTNSFMNNILDKTRLREPRPGQHDDEGFYEHQVNPHTGEPDFRYGDQDTTADTHHVRAHSIHPDADLSNVSYGTPPWFSDKMTVGGQTHHLGYELSQRINQTANAELNHEEPDPLRHTLPKQGQATGWVQWKGGLNAAGKGAGTAPAGTPPKAYDPAKKNFGLGPKNKGVDPETGKPMLDPNPAPQHQRDVASDDWFQDPRVAPPGKAFDGDWEHTPGDGGQPGAWTPPDRATTTFTTEPKKGEPQSFTHENYDPRMAPNWQRRDKYHQFMGSRYDRELLAFVDGVLAGIDLGPEFQKSVMKDVDETGGFSRRGPQKAPDKGFMVAQPGTEKIEPSPGFSGQSISDYGQQHTPAMEADPDLYQGGWNDEESGDFYHDLSKHHNDIWDAAKAGYGENEDDAQHGVYDLGTGTTFSPLELHNKWGPGYMMARRED